jgi:hypothetical protein
MTVPERVSALEVRWIKREFDPKTMGQIDVTAKLGTLNFEAIHSSTERPFVFDPRPRKTR